MNINVYTTYDKYTSILENVPGNYLPRKINERKRRRERERKEGGRERDRERDRERETGRERGEVVRVVKKRMMTSPKLRTSGTLTSTVSTKMCLLLTILLSALLAPAGVEASASANTVYNVIAVFPRYALSSGGRMTVMGNECSFPFEYRGDQIFDCIALSGGSSQCKTLKGAWEECRPGGNRRRRRGLAQRATTINGDECVFPIVYRGQVYNECVEISGKSQCKDSRGVWSECGSPGGPPAAPGSSSPAGPVTVDGESCVFPLIYRGQVYQSCFDVSGKQMCKIANGSFKECAADTGAPTDAAAADDAEGPEIVFPTGSYYGQIYETLSSLCEGGEVSTYFKPTCAFTATFVEYQPGAEEAVGLITAKLKEIGATAAYDHLIVGGPEFADAPPAFTQLAHHQVHHLFQTEVDHHQ